MARVCFALAMLLGAARAEAQARTIAVKADGCRKEIVEVLRVELRGEVEIAEGAEELRFSGACTEVVRVWFRGGYREVKLTGVDRAIWGRVVAMVGAEIVRGDGHERDSEHQPEREHDRDRDHDRRRERAGDLGRLGVARVDARGIESLVAIGTVLQVFTAEGGRAMYGVEAGVDWRSLSAGVTGTIGGTSDSLGMTSYRRLHAFAAVALLEAELGAFRFGAGPRAGGGATFGAATSNHRSATSNRTVDATGEVGLEGTVVLALSTDWVARLRTGAGYALGPRYLANSRILADLDGLYLSASLQVGLTLASER